MLDTVLGFFVGVMVSHWFIWPALIFAVFCDYREWRRFAVFTSAIFIIALYLMFKPPWEWIRIGLIVYLPIGFLWSFLRYRRYVGKQVKQFNKKVDYDPTYYNETFISSLKLKTSVHSNVDRIVYWVALWPISFIQSFFADVFAGIEHLVNKILYNLYEYIQQSALKKINPPDPLSSESDIRET